VNRYFSLIPVVILITTACDQKAPQVTPLPRMVKAAEVTPSVIHSSAFSRPH
jgi:hypothetical protein